MKLKYCYPLFLFFLTSCSSISSMKFWENAEVDIDEPMPLVAINNSENISENWKIKFSGTNDLGNFIPSFSADKLFFSDETGSINSYEASSGNLLWTIQESELSSGTASGFGVVVVSDKLGNVISYDQNDGSKLWSKNVKAGVLSQAAIDASVVIVKTSAGELIALDKNSGEIVWSYRSQLPLLTVRGSSSPVIDDDKVIATFDNGRLVVFQLATGFPLWDGAISYVSGTSELDNLVDADSNPVIAGSLIYAVNYQGNLNIFDQSQKRSIWKSEASSFYSPVITKGLIIVVENNSKIITYSNKTLEESWSSDEYLNRSLSNPISFKGNLLVGDNEGYLHIINPINGKTVGRKKISKQPLKYLSSRGNAIYVVDDSFSLFSLSL
ncbi:outer membrane protein assembly factor BamB [Gammaproteobacteria bacterium]|nr:outer membrane protein assembly factor BamB [Gammaproteobacteria bacterium]